jgi:stage II sporulation protein AA (anti-sigma F factor antagonist)
MPARIPPDRLNIDVDGGPDGVVLRLDGELDAATAAQLEHSLASLQTRASVLVLDLHALRFVDSLGLNMLFRAREWALARSMTLRVVRAPVHVQRLIALAALDSTFGPFYTDAAAALRA